MPKVLLCVTLALPLTGASVPVARPTYRPEYSKPLPRAQRRPSPDMLYSLRARRRAAILLRMELLELHKAQLDRAKAVLEGTLTLEELLGPPAKAARH